MMMRSALTNLVSRLKAPVAVKGSDVEKNWQEEILNCEQAYN